MKNEKDKDKNNVPHAYSGERKITLVESQEALLKKIPKICPCCGKERNGIFHLIRLCTYSSKVAFPVLARAGENQIKIIGFNGIPIYFDFIGWQCPRCLHHNAFQEIYRLINHEKESV